MSGTGCVKNWREGLLDARVPTLHGTSDMNKSYMWHDSYWREGLLGEQVPAWNALHDSSIFVA